MNFGRNLWIWAAVIVLLFVLFEMFQGGNNATNAAELPYSEFLNKVEAGEVNNVTIRGPEITLQTSSGTYTTYAPDDPKLIETLTSKGVAIKAGPQEEKNLLFIALVQWAPIILIVAFWIFMLRQMQSNGGKAMGFGKIGRAHV